MVDDVRHHLARVQELTAQLNSHADEVNRQVSAIEDYLTQLGVGVEVSAYIEGDDDGDSVTWVKYLRYGRVGDRFRICMVDVDFVYLDSEGSPDEKITLWSNASRDERLAAYDKLPNLLEKVVQGLETRVERIKATASAIQDILKTLPPVRKGGKK